jgi:MerR family copper efflux transcriptional regulator
MKISDLATKTGTTPKTLRFYEEISLLSPPERTLSGYRDYDESAIARIQFVKAGQAIGLTLAEIRNLLLIREEGTSPCRAAIDLLDQHLEEVTRRISELKNLKRDLSELRVRAKSLDPTECPQESICHIINPAH